MTSMRRLFRDRVTAGLWVVLIAAALLLQGVLASVVQGRMAAAAADPLNVICSDHGTGPISPAGDPRDKSVDCPCATLCRLAATAMPAVLGEPAALVVQYSAISAAPLLRLADLSVAPPLDLSAPPRAPPSVSPS